MGEKMKWREGTSPLNPLKSRPPEQWGACTDGCPLLFPHLRDQKQPSAVRTQTFDTWRKGSFLPAVALTSCLQGGSSSSTCRAWGRDTGGPHGASWNWPKWTTVYHPSLEVAGLYQISEFQSLISDSLPVLYLLWLGDQFLGLPTLPSSQKALSSPSFLKDSFVASCSYIITFLVKSFLINFYSNIIFIMC